MEPNLTHPDVASCVPSVGCSSGRSSRNTCTCTAEYLEEEKCMGKNTNLKRQSLGESTVIERSLQQHKQPPWQSNIGILSIFLTKYYKFYILFGSDLKTTESGTALQPNFETKTLFLDSC